MAEYVNKEKLLLKLEEKISYMTLGDDETYEEWWGVTKRIINNTPTIDIVHCEECEHWEQDDREHIIGVCNGGYVPRGIRINMLYTDYCSYGERKEQ